MTKINLFLALMMPISAYAYDYCICDAGFFVVPDDEPNCAKVCATPTPTPTPEATIYLEGGGCKNIEEACKYCKDLYDKD